MDVLPLAPLPAVDLKQTIDRAMNDTCKALGELIDGSMSAATINKGIAALLVGTRLVEAWERQQAPAASDPIHMFETGVSDDYCYEEEDDDDDASASASGVVASKRRRTEQG